MKMNLFELICRAFTIADEMPCLFITSESSEGEHFAVEFRESESVMELRYINKNGDELSFSYKTNGLFLQPKEMDSAELVGKLRKFEKETGVDFASTEWRWDYSTLGLMQTKVEKLTKALKFQEEDS